MNFKNFVQQNINDHDKLVEQYLSKAALKPLILHKHKDIYKAHHLKVDIIKKFRAH